jgi:titin
MIKLTWDDNSDNEYGFIIERDGSQIADVNANVTTYYDRALSTNREYHYTVRSFNEIGNSRSSNEVSATAVSIPNPPSYLDATAISSSKIELTWADNSDNETGFKVERKKSGEAFSQIKTVEKNITTYIDTGLTADTKYLYRVRAYNNMGNSKYTTDVSVLTAQPAMIIKLIVGSATYYINNQTKTMDAAPIIKDNRTLLPIKYVAEAIGANVVWDNNERKVTISLKETTIELWIGQSSAKVNGGYKLIDSSNNRVTPIIVEPGRTMLPIRFISENLGAKVDWNSSKREVTVTYPAP